MARRLTPAARRAEIIEIANAAISEEGFSGLSLREVARRCQMTAPGLMHYFPDMPTLLSAVLDHRDETESVLIASEFTSQTTVAEVLEAARRYYLAEHAGTASFDALEVEAIVASHPAHDYYARRDARNFERLLPYIEREFADPEFVADSVRLLLDGLKLRRLRGPSDEQRRKNSEADWQVLQMALATFAKRPEFGALGA